MKTSELIGPALDWAVAKCEGKEKNWDKSCLKPYKMYFGQRYSTDWTQGGPIIEREGISVQQFDGSSPAEQRWNAYRPGEIPLSSTEEINGSTPLIAAMRCFVYSKLGDNVDVPKELQ